MGVTNCYKTAVFFTAELGKALPVVKVTSQVKTPNFRGPAIQKTISVVNMKFSTIDYIGPGNPQPTCSNNQITGVSPRMGEV